MISKQNDEHVTTHHSGVVSELSASLAWLYRACPSFCDVLGGNEALITKLCKRKEWDSANLSTKKVNYALYILNAEYVNKFYLDKSIPHSYENTCWSRDTNLSLNVEMAGHACDIIQLQNPNLAN